MLPWWRIWREERRGSGHALAADKLGKKRRQPIVNVFSHSNGEMILAMESLNRKATLRL